MGYKIERLQERIKFKVANVIQRDLADPRLGLVTVTKVKLARDLSECEVFYSVLGDDGARSKTARMLADSRGFIQSEVAKILATRRAPRLDFVFDESIEGSVRISEALRRELGDADEAGDEAERDEEVAPEE
ncbi:MAG: 30S ribosome-binding factor RbfA [Planctomycetota bacterium]